MGLRIGDLPRVVVVGAGMGGLSVVRGLQRSQLNVTLLDAHNYTTFPPMLFYVASGFLAPEDVVRPVRAMLPGRGRVGFRLGSVESIDWEKHAVTLADGRRVGYDYLVLAPGVVPSFGAVPGAADYAVPMKTALDAASLRNTLLRSFESAAERPALVSSGATSVAIIGGGPTGVEVAGYIADFLFRYSFAHDYPDIPRSQMRISVIEVGDRLLSGMHPRLSSYALRRLSRRGVDVRLNTRVERVDASGVTLDSGERLPATTIVWAGGVSVAEWVTRLGLGTEDGRIVVDPDLRIAGYPDAFAIGDAAAVHSPDGVLYPQVAQVALQNGRHTAHQIQRLVAKQSTEPFRYHDKGGMAMVGRNAAVIQAGRLHLTGFPAWVAWGMLHLAYLPGIVNKLSAGQKFLLWHLTHDSSARILLERQPRQSPQALTPTTNLNPDTTTEVASERD
jgi:NADH:ubiquinone reductase (H+-translocating)